MSDVLGAFVDLTKLEKSLSWLVNWAKRHEKKDEDPSLFYAFDSYEFKNCPNFCTGFFALTALRKETARVENGQVEINVYRLARLEL